MCPSFPMCCQSGSFNPLELDALTTIARASLVASFGAAGERLQLALPSLPATCKGHIGAPEREALQPERVGL